MSIPFFSDTIEICTLVWNVVSDYQDAPETFKNFSDHVRRVGNTVKRLEKKTVETTFLQELDADSKQDLIDQMTGLHEALKPMLKVQSDYQPIEREILAQRKKYQKDAQGGLQASLRGTFGGRSSPQLPEKRKEFAKRKWKQTIFSRFKMDDVYKRQLDLDRRHTCLVMFVGFEFSSTQIPMSASQQTLQTATSIQVSELRLRQREKISCLFVDDKNTDDSIIAQSYAELIKLWTLDNRAASPFGKLSSAGLHVRSSLVTPSLFPSVDLSSPGETPSHSALTTLFPGTPEADEMCSASFLGSKCSEVRRLKARTYAHASRGICDEDFVKFDLIVACSEEVYLELEALHDVVMQMLASKQGQGFPSAKLRLLRLPDLEKKERVEDRVVRFARDETSWWEPQRRKIGLRQETNCAFRTRQAVVGMRSEDLMTKVGCVEGVVVFVEPIDGLNGEESLLTITGKFGKLEKAFGDLEKSISMRKY